MALSEKEQELLAQMEAALTEEDPRFAHTLRGAGLQPRQRRRVSLAGLGLVIGLVVLIAGLQVHWLVSVVGFVIMLAATAVFQAAWPPRPAAVRRQPAIEDVVDRWRRESGEN